ncbi:phytanoyl-CoA dioxygenase family protein [Bradyrhizobium zhanjiangense]|uniref:phytanoyl-CoA dioxygenase family protein n=1 Tax=Bradyrhizobium zhanjiangense TaxID=1325107 RepID=UPI0010092828|nr:phytanoyl-CoA dioxygenase family protein [Bradyrhizobium zhanjiangense]
MLAMNSEEVAAYSLNGFVVRKNLISSKEISLYRDRARVPIEAEIDGGSVFAKKDKDGKTSLFKRLMKADEDRYGFLGRDTRLVDLAQDAVGKPIYRYYHEMILKQPINGGAWEWHQDFGTYFTHGCLAPQMVAIYVALDQATKESGCMRVLKGSHKLGRLDHVRQGEQITVDEGQIEAALKRFEPHYVEMEPGDAMVFDGNLLHRSDANRSSRHLWAYICCYNAVDNAPFKHVCDYGHYEPLEKITAAAFLRSA